MRKNTGTKPKTTEQRRNVDDDEGSKISNRSRAAWVGFRPGEIVSLQDATTRQHIVGAVETKTDDGLIIWIRDDLNDRKAYHFDDCLSARALG